MTKTTTPTTTSLPELLSRAQRQQALSRESLEELQLVLAPSFPQPAKTTSASTVQAAGANAQLEALVEELHRDNETLSGIVKIMAEYLGVSA